MLGRSTPGKAAPERLARAHALYRSETLSFTASTTLRLVIGVRQGKLAEQERMEVGGVHIDRIDRVGSWVKVETPRSAVAQVQHNSSIHRLLPFGRSAASRCRARCRAGRAARIVHWLRGAT